MKKTMVQCIETGETFPSVKSAAESFGVSSKTMFLYLSNKRKHDEGYTFIRVNMETIDNDNTLYTESGAEISSNGENVFCNNISDEALDWIQSMKKYEDYKISIVREEENSNDIILGCANEYDATSLRRHVFQVFNSLEI